MGRGAEVRAAFAEQAKWCERLGSPFTARLCGLLGRRLDRSTSVGTRVLDWPGAPEPGGDALALRLCGGLHALVLRGEAPELARLYPPAPMPDEETLRAALAAVLDAKAESLDAWLDRAPQTNEVGRSAALMSGLLAVAARFPHPIQLFELGASAGLNLLLDRYCFDLRGVAAGDPASALLLKPEWRGRPPPRATVRIAGRQGVDLAPLDAVADRERLTAYVWPDQRLRLEQLRTALDIAAEHPPSVEAADAAEWIEARLTPEASAGTTRAVLHSVAFQYFPLPSQERIAAHLAGIGAAATEESPLAWLSFELGSQSGRFELRLRTWPGEERLLARAHPHVAWLEWLDG